MRYPFIAPVNGATQYQDAIRKVRPGDTFTIRREPDNPYDPNALAIYHDKAHALVGYLPAPLAARIEDDLLAAEVAEIYTRGTWGLRIRVTGPLVTVEAAAGSEVRTLSGRKLGELVRIEGEAVVVRDRNGEVSYPLAVVEIIDGGQEAAGELSEEAAAESGAGSDSKVA